MTLIIILICAAIEHFTHQLNRIRRYNWLKQYLLWFRRAFSNLDSTVTLLLALSPIMILGLLLLANVNTTIWFILAIFTLSYSIGPQNTEIQVTDYCDALERDDTEGAALYAEQLRHGQQSMSDTSQLNQHVINAILVNTNERITAVIFWFLLLGPMGALLYRCSERATKYSNDDEQLQILHESAQRLFFILSWLPARLTAFSFALGGSMSDALHNWRNYQCDWEQHYCDSNRGILICSGLGALQIAPDSASNCLENVQFTLALANRALIIWISFLAILSLAGYA